MDAAVLFVRYGAMHHVGRFVAAAGCRDRGSIVVVESARGTELGEVLAASTTADGNTPSGRVLRLATVEDRDRARLLELERERRLMLCERVLREADLPVELIDAECVFEEGRTVVTYLGPAEAVSSAVLESVRESYGLDLVFQAACRETLQAMSRRVTSPSPTSGGGCGGSDGGGCASCAIGRAAAGRPA